MENSSAAAHDHRIEDFRRLFRDAGLPLTHQREVIFRTVIEMRNHPSPESIYEKVRRRIPSISLATVYKNIRTFVDAGLLREVSLHHGTLRLETNPEEHHHLVCTECRTIVDLDLDAVEPIRMRRPLPDGFRVSRQSVELSGLCPACAKKQNKS